MSIVVLAGSVSRMFKTPTLTLWLLFAFCFYIIQSRLIMPTTRKKKNMQIKLICPDKNSILMCMLKCFRHDVIFKYNKYLVGQDVFIT